MKRVLSYFLFTMLILTLSNCDLVKSEYEGVLITNCGRNGIDDFKIVTGRVNTMGPCTDLIKVPMFEVVGDLEPFTIRSRNNDEFTVDPRYGYQPIRGEGPQIVYNYKQHASSDADAFMNAIEENILNPKIADIYREESRKFDTDSLLNNISTYESNVENRLFELFKASSFELKQLTSDVKPPARLSEAMQQRAETDIKTEQAMKAIQTEKALLEIELQKAEAQVEIAKKEAEANLERSKGLNDRILIQQFIKKWDGVVPAGSTLDDLYSQFKAAASKN